jgi:hypothetical protein
MQGKAPNSNVFNEFAFLQLKVSLWMERDPSGRPRNSTANLYLLTPKPCCVVIIPRRIANSYLGYQSQLASLSLTQPLAASIFFINLN